MLGLKRNIFAFNKSLDQNIVSPLSVAYVKTIPHSIRKNISNHLEWMDTPSTIVNSVLQMDLENTILASAKFMLNGLSFGFYDFDNNETKLKCYFVENTIIFLSFYGGLGPPLTLGWSETLIFRFRRNMVSFLTLLKAI